MGLFSDLEPHEQIYATDIEVRDTLLNCPIASRIFRGDGSEGDAAFSGGSDADQLFSARSFLYIFKEMKLERNNDANIDDKLNSVSLKELRELTATSPGESKMLHLLELLIDVALKQGIPVERLHDYPLTKLHSVPRYTP